SLERITSGASSSDSAADVSPPQAARMLAADSSRAALARRRLYEGGIYWCGGVCVTVTSGDPVCPGGATRDAFFEDTDHLAAVGLEGCQPALDVRVLAQVGLEPRRQERVQVPDGFEAQLHGSGERVSGHAIVVATISRAADELYDPETSQQPGVIRHACLADRKRIGHLVEREWFRGDH